jgi:glucoamylase
MSRHATGRATRHPASGRRHKIEGLGAAAVAAALVVAPAAAVTDASGATKSNVASAGLAAGAAPGVPGTPSTWALGDHDGFGTARGTKSKVWYTLRKGKLTDVYYPRIDTPSIRDSQFVVTGKRFTDREDQDARSRVQLLDSRSLVYRVTTTAKSGKWRIVKTFVTDPARSTVLQRVRFTSLTGAKYKLFLLHDPALTMTGNDDQGRTGQGHRLLSWDGTTSSAVATNPAMTRTSSGYLGTSDGWTDLKSDHRMNWTTDATVPGNVVQTGRIPVNGVRSHGFTVAIGFGHRMSKAVSVARRSLAHGFGSARSAYDRGWHRYLGSLRKMPASAQAWSTQWRVSAMVLAASEDKTVRGGFVAAPGRPWAWANSLQSLAVYHAVWSRDLYEIATGLLAVGDRAAANRALSFLWRVQQKPDGSFPQNSRLDGTPVFGDLQMDEVAFPIVLAHQLGRTGAPDWAHVKRAADFIVANGPSTPQERWENAGGYSPATIAAEIAGLVTAASIATKNGDASSASSYLAKADEWQAAVQGWTASTNGGYGPKPYYLRVTKNGDPDVGTLMQVSDGGPNIDQRLVVDPSFLELVRLGVKPAGDQAIRNSIAVVDDKLSYNTKNGRFWHRASFDGYGEQSDGSQWEPSDPGSGKTLGRGWPLLSGERGEYALVAGHIAAAKQRLASMARAADDDSFLMSEQVWDHRAPAPSRRAIPGEPTLSAAPLAWTHAQFLRLAASIATGSPVEIPQVVACRYHSEACAS